MLKQLKEEKGDIKENLGEVEGMLKSPRLITFKIEMQTVTAHDKIQYISLLTNLIKYFCLLWIQYRTYQGNL